MSDDDQIQRVERLLAVTQQLTHIGSWQWDLATNVVTWSDELFRIYGYEPRSREITFEFFLSCLVPDDRARVQGEVGAALERGEPFAYVERVVRPDGSVRVLDTVGEPTRDAAGHVTGLIGTCRDVTEERRRDEQIQLYGDIVRNMQIGIAVWEVGAPDDMKSIRLVAYNPAAERVSRRSLEGTIGKSLFEVLPYSEGGFLPGLIAEVARDGVVREGALDRGRNPEQPDRTLAVKSFPLPGGRVGIAVEDTTEKTKMVRLQAAEHRMLERLAAGAPLPEALGTLVSAVEEHLGGCRGAILQLDPEGRYVHYVAAPNVPPAFVTGIEGQPVGPTSGSSGTAMHRRAPVYTIDTETDPGWGDYRELARKNAIRACWSTPILATDGRVLGALAIYHPSARAPSPGDIAAMDRATRLAGLAIERRQLEDQLRELSAHVESIREDERATIAREIHDDLGQALTALKLDIAWLSRRLAGASSRDDVTMPEKLRAMSDMTDEVIERVRRISSELRPGVLDDLGLLAALEWQGQEFEQRTEVTCAIRSNVGDEQLGPALSTGIFRIFQEALTNVARHARAHHVDVTLERGAGELLLVVRDDGVGIAPEATRSLRSLGLLGMRERARRLGGAAVVQAAQGGGTVVEVRVPLAQATS